MADFQGWQKQRLTGEIGPAGGRIVGRAGRQAPQSVVGQLSVADLESQQDTIDVILGGRLPTKRRRRRGQRLTPTTD